MTRIQTNVHPPGLNNLRRTSDLLTTSLTRLSTGLQINNGRDNPSGLIGSETLRSQIVAIEQSVKNSNRANNVLSTADAALGEISNLLLQVRGLVQEGLNEGALSGAEIAANQKQIDAALSAINRIASNASFAGDKLIDGSKGFTTVISTADVPKISDYQVDEAIFGSQSTVLIDTTVVTAAEKGVLRYQGGALASQTNLEISGSQGGQVLFFGSSTSYANLKTAINASSDVTGVAATISSVAAASTKLVNSTNTNSDLTFTDKRATSDSGSNTTLGGAITVNFQNPAANSSALSVTVTGSAITVRLGTAAAGTVNSTAAAIKTAIAAKTAANALVLVTQEGAGGGVVTVIGTAQTLTGGTNALLTLSSTNFGADEFVDVNVLSGTFATTNLAAASVRRDAGTDIIARINGQTALGQGLKTSISTASLAASVTIAEASNVAAVNAKITITGGGSLFQIGQEASVAGKISIGIETINTARLGGITGKIYELGSGGGKTLLDVGPSVQGSTLVKIIGEALDRVNGLRGRLGAVQKNVIETNISSLGVALENITLARSQIIDTDYAAETANLTKAQILSQAGLSTLAIANQNPQQVLTLLR